MCPTALRVSRRFQRSRRQSKGRSSRHPLTAEQSEEAHFPDSTFPQHIKWNPASVRVLRRNRLPNTCLPQQRTKVVYCTELLRTRPPRKSVPKPPPQRRPLPARDGLRHFNERCSIMEPGAMRPSWQSGRTLPGRRRRLEVRALDRRLPCRSRLGHGQLGTTLRASDDVFVPVVRMPALSADEASVQTGKPEQRPLSPYSEH